MIRVTFFEPQTIKQHGIDQECLFVDCLYIEPVFPNEHLDGILQFQFGEGSDYCRVEMKLIDVIQPTTL